MRNIHEQIANIRRVWQRCIEGPAVSRLGSLADGLMRYYTTASGLCRAYRIHAILQQSDLLRAGTQVVMYTFISCYYLPFGQVISIVVYLFLYMYTHVGCSYLLWYSLPSIRRLTTG